MAPDSREQLAEALSAGLADDGAQALRERIAREVPAALASNGQRLSIHHSLGRDAAGVGFATATEMAAELGEGARRMYEVGLWYPGAALVRQLIECGYLLALMSENRDEARDWMTSSHEQIVAQFMPRHIKRRAVRNFRASEYEKHCDLGGHPNPAGRVLLRRHAEEQLVPPRIHWVDLVQHLVEVWINFVAALPLYDPRKQPADPLCDPQRSPEGNESVLRLLVQQQEREPLAAWAIPDMG
jgi:hypothetical protein